MKVGVVGLGKMGLLHSCILSTLPGVEVVAVCDRSWVIRRVFKKLFKNAVVVDDVVKMVSLGLDAVYVTTPIPSHYSVVKAVYSNKVARHLFVEKTLAMNFGQAKELCDLAESFGGVNMVGYMKRYAVTFRKAKELIDNGVIGDLESLSAYAYSSDFAEASVGSKESLSRGGVLSDLGSHIIDLMLWFFGDLTVESAAVNSVLRSGSEDAVHFNVKAQGGIFGEVDVSWCKREYRMPEFSLTICGKDGLIKVDDDQVILELKNGDLRKWYRHDLGDAVGFLIGAPEYYREDEAFVKAVQEGSHVEPDFFEASKVDYLIEEVKRRRMGNDSQ